MWSLPPSAARHGAATLTGPQNPLIYSSGEEKKTQREAYKLPCTITFSDIGLHMKQQTWKLFLSIINKVNGC